MNKLILTSALVAVLSVPALAAGAQSIAVGAEVQIGSDAEAERVSERIYAVSVDGGRRDSREDVYEEALYLAAKKTLRNDYDWFRIVERQTEKETTRTQRRSEFSGRYERVPERRCGLLNCTTTYRDYYHGGFDTGSPAREDSVYTVTLEFQMGYGPYRNSVGVYDAQSVKANYK